MKTNITKEIEFAVYQYFYLERGYRCGFEVKSPISMGRVDMFGLNENNKSICVEIKISKSDFKSKNGHNFFASLNYYAVPAELVDYARSNAPDHVGILSVHYNRRLEQMKEQYENYNIKKHRLFNVRTEKKARTKETTYDLNRMKSILFTAMASNVLSSRRNEIESQETIDLDKQFDGLPFKETIMNKIRKEANNEKDNC